MALTDLTEAGERFRRDLNAETWPRALPWERRLRRGDLDFWLVHAVALENLDELLAELLPIGIETFTARSHLVWLGWHPDRQIVVTVNLLSGAWDEPSSGANGTDLVSFTARMANVGQGEAARRLARFFRIPNGWRRHE